MKKIEEIRIAGSTDGSPIASIGGVLGSLFLNYMGDYSMGDEVNILGIQFNNKNFEDDSIEISFNHNNTYNLYYMHITISTKYFESLKDYTKIEFICKCIYKALLEWAKKFNLPDESIHLANKKIIENDFFCESSKKYKSKNKKYTCSIEYRYEFESTTYRLNVLDNNTKEIRKYFICNKKYFKDNELMKTDYMKWLNTPRTLKVTGWINEDEFEMYWGEEKFIFNSITTEIATVGL